MKHNKLTPQETFMKSAFGNNLSPEERSDLRKSLAGGAVSLDRNLTGNEKMNNANKYSEKSRQGLKLDSMGGTVPNVPIQQAKSGIRIKPENKGKFTAKANAQDMGVQEYARKVMGAPEGKYSPETRRQANFARNASKWKKQTGGYTNPTEEYNYLNNMPGLGRTLVDSKKQYPTYKTGGMSAGGAKSYDFQKFTKDGEWKKGGYAASGVKDYQYTNYSKKKV